MEPCRIRAASSVLAWMSVSSSRQVNCAIPFPISPSWERLVRAIPSRIWHRLANDSGYPMGTALSQILLEGADGSGIMYNGDQVGGNLHVYERVRSEMALRLQAAEEQTVEVPGRPACAQRGDQRAVPGHQCSHWLAARDREPAPAEANGILPGCVWSIVRVVLAQGALQDEYLHIWPQGRVSLSSRCLHSRRASTSALPASPSRLLVDQ